MSEGEISWVIHLRWSPPVWLKLYVFFIVFQVAFSLLILFKKTLSINHSENPFLETLCCQKGINKWSQSIWPRWLLTIKIISQASWPWLPSSLLTDRQIAPVCSYSVISCQRELSLRLTSILFSPFSQSLTLPLTIPPCVWGQWLREDATWGHQPEGQV